MDLVNHTLTKGQALVLVGPQGCGKTTMASQIAQKHGSFIRIDDFELENEHLLAAALSGEPDTVIVEGMPAKEETLCRLKTMLTNDTITIRTAGQEPRLVKSPNFIFCSGDIEPVPGVDISRRFFVVRMGH